MQILQTTSPFNWRLREVLAQQLPRLAPLLTPDSVFFAVVPVAFGLLNDPVAVVREKTFEASLVVEFVELPCRAVYCSHLAIASRVHAGASRHLAIGNHHLVVSRRGVSVGEWCGRVV